MYPVILYTSDKTVVLAICSTDYQPVIRTYSYTTARLKINWRRDTIMARKIRKWYARAE
jgi:hypothetical protein